MNSGLAGHLYVAWMVLMTIMVLIMAGLEIIRSCNYHTFVCTMIGHNWREAVRVHGVPVLRCQRCRVLRGKGRA